MNVRRALVALALGAGIVLAAPGLASAHPLGNFTINRYAGIRVARDRVRIDYVVDMAEIPTFQTKPDVDRNGDGRVSSAEARAYERTECRRLARGVRLALDGRRLAVGLVPGGALRFPIGQAGLETLRLECRLEAPTTSAAGAHTLAYADRNLTGRIGWREITAVGDGTTLVRSHVATRSISERLTKYPSDRLTSPLDERTARVRFNPGGVTAPVIRTPFRSPASSVSGFDDLTNSLTSSVAARRLTLGLGLLSIAIAITLGALHAFAPGHGKTVMAAYLVGERGGVRDGLLIGLTVAVTHTLGVLLLGAVLTASQTFAPESVYPWLGAASGVCFVALGLTLLVSAIRRRRGIATTGILAGHLHGVGHHTHHHDDDHHHTHHHDEVHEHGAPAMSRRRLLTLGFAGGLVPTPTAIVVLLGATAIGRAWFGILLVVAYGVGMASTLVAGGLLLARARRRFDLRKRSDRLVRFATALPIGTAVVVTGGGLWLVARAAAAV